MSDQPKLQHPPSVASTANTATDSATATSDNAPGLPSNRSPNASYQNPNENRSPNPARARRYAGTPRDYTVAKTTSFKTLAAKLAGEARKGAIQSLRAMGANNINTVVKGFALARRYIEEQHLDINCWVQFIEVPALGGNDTGSGEVRTAIRFEFNRTTLRSQVRSIGVCVLGVAVAALDFVSCMRMLVIVSFTMSHGVISVIYVSRCGERLLVLFKFKMRV